MTWIYFHLNEIRLYSVYPWIQHLYPISLPELGPIAPPNGFVSLSVSLYSSISLPLIQSLFHNHYYMSGDVPHSKSIKTSKQSFSYPNTVQAEGASVSWACEKEQSCWLFPSGNSLKTSIFTIQAQTTTEIWIQMASVSHTGYSGLIMVAEACNPLKKERAKKRTGTIAFRSLWNKLIMANWTFIQST